MFTSAVLLNPVELQCTGVESGLNIHKEFGLQCIVVNDPRREDESYVAVRLDSFVVD